MHDYPTNLTRATAENMLDDAQPGQLPLAIYPGRVWIHSFHLDKKNLPRTYCGVPIGVISKWSQRGFGNIGDVTCATCQGAVSKLDRPGRTGGTPEAKKTASRRESVCFAVLDGRRVPSATGAHVPNVLKTDHLGKPISPFCTWCGANLSEAERDEYDPTSNLVTDHYNGKHPDHDHFDCPRCEESQEHDAGANDQGLVADGTGAL